MKVKLAIGNSKIGMMELAAGRPDQAARIGWRVFMKQTRQIVHQISVTGERVCKRENKWREIEWRHNVCAMRSRMQPHQSAIVA